MEPFTKGDRVAFTVYGLRLEGTVVRVRKSDSMVTVEAPVVSRMTGRPLMDTSETMYWDVQPALLERTYPHSKRAR